MAQSLNYKSDSTIISNQTVIRPRRREQLTESLQESTLLDLGAALLKDGEYKKNQTIKFQFLDILKEFTYFRNLENDEEYYDYIEQFLYSLEYKFIPQNEFIFHYGDPGDHFYLVFKGKADIYTYKLEEELQFERDLINLVERAAYNKATATNLTEFKIWKEKLDDAIEKLEAIKKQENLFLELSNKSSIRYFQKTANGRKLCLFKKVNTVNPGDSFGEVSLFQDQNRAASILVSQDMELGIIKKKQFLKIFDKKRQKLNFVLEVISRAFPGATREAIIQMSFDFQKRTYLIHQTIFKKGDKVDGLYLIYQGNVELWFEFEKLNQKSKRMRVCQIVEKQFFGLADFFRRQEKNVRQYTAITNAPENIIYYIPKKQINGIYDIKVRKGLDLQFQVKEKWFEKRVQEIQDIEQKKSIDDNQKKLVKQSSKHILMNFLNDKVDEVKEVETGIKMQMKTESDKTTTNQNLNSDYLTHREIKKQIRRKKRNGILTFDKIKEIVAFNEKLYDKSEPLPEQVTLCQEMKPFNLEKKEIEKLEFFRKNKVRMSLPKIVKNEKSSQTFQMSVDFSDGKQQYQNGLDICAIPSVQILPTNDEDSAIRRRVLARVFITDSDKKSNENQRLKSLQSIKDTSAVSHVKLKQMSNSSFVVNIHTRRLREEKKLSKSSKVQKAII